MERSDVFISYRRKDVDFVKQLDTALKTTGREVWVDWEDIPPGIAGFTDEIVRGIEGADAMIVVLSPDYMESEYCLMELKQAIDLKKRVVPVVLHKFDSYPTPEGIGHINWVYFCPHAGQNNAFDESFPKVIAAIESDFEHMRTHTRLLLRAREWEQKQKHTSFLLIGEDLSAAEGWLTAGVGKQPAPISLHADYIAASRQNAQRRQQIYTAIASVVAVILLILSGFAVTQWVSAQQNYEVAQANLVRAEAAEGTAVFQRDQAKAEVLAAQSELELDGLLAERGVLLALAALEDYPYVANAERALAKAVEEHRLRQIYPGIFVSVSPDESRLMTFDTDSQVHIWETATGTELFSFEAMPLPEEAAGSQWLRYYGDWSPDGKVILVYAPDDTLTLYDNASGQLIAPIPVTGGVLNVSWSPDNTRLLTLEGSSLSLWDATGKPIATLPVTADAIWRGVWSPDSSRLAVGSLEGSLSVWDTNTGTQIAQSENTSPNLFSYQWSSDSKTLYLQSFDFRENGTAIAVQVIDAATGRETGPEELTRNPLPTAVMSPDGSHFAIVTTTREREQGQFFVQVWNTTRQEAVAEFDPLTVIGNGATIEPNLFWSPDGGQLAFRVMADPAGLYLWSLRDNQGVLLINASFPVIWSPDGTRAVTFDQAVRAFTVWNTGSGEKLSSLGGLGEEAQAFWTADGSFVMTLASDRTARIWEPETGEARFNFAMPNVGESLLLSQGVTSRLTVLDVAGTVRAWDVTGNNTFDTTGTGASAQGLAPGMRLSSPVWSPDGTRILMSNGDLSATVWAISADGNAPLFTLAPTTEGAVCANCPPQPDLILDAAWTPEGTRIATAQCGEIIDFGVEGDSRINRLSCSNGSVKVWNGTTGEAENLYTGAEGSPAFSSVAWSPDGTRLAASTQGYSPQIGEQAERITPKIFIWDAATTGSLLLTLEGHEGDTISSLAWSHDGTRIVSAANDATARVWDAADGTLLFTFSEHTHWVTTAAWSPDDSRIVTASWDGRVLVWDSQSGEVQTTFTRHTDWPNSAVWSPNGERILSASWDKTALIWEADSGDVVGTLEGHEDAVLGASWSPDGTQAMTLSSDDTARLWRAWQSLDALEADAALCCIVRDLTDDERALFGLEAGG